MRAKLFGAEFFCVCVCKVTSNDGDNDKILSR